MSNLIYHLHVARIFLARGPHYHLQYLRWHSIRIAQRLFPYAYRNLRSDSLPVGVIALRERVSPAFFFKPDSIPGIVSSIPLHSRAACIAAADRICAHEFAFREAPAVHFGQKIDWNHQPQGNTDWRWDLNRHAFFETLGFAHHYSGDAKYAQQIVTLANDWLTSNSPHPGGVNWQSPFEAAFRINSWTWAFFLIRACGQVDDDKLSRLLRGIEAHCQYVFTNLEFHSRNNHLLLEAKALLLAAILFPEFRDSRKWEQRTRTILYREIRHQVHPDGIHGEMSTHYHRVIAGELLELLILHRVNHLSLPDDIVTTIRKMAEAETAITRPDGTLPLIGDASQSDTYARLSARLAAPRVFDLGTGDATTLSKDEAAIWRLAEIPAGSRALSNDIDRRSVAFSSGGLYVMRSGSGIQDRMQLCAACGPFGLASDPHHGHADALSIDVFALGRPWIVDSGVFSTHTDWNWRQYFRGTRSHNTIMIDGLDQTVLLDSRRAMCLANATCGRWLTTPVVDFFEGFHDGYERLAAPVTHKRQIWFVRGEYWLILDSLSGDGVHDVELMYHCSHDLQVTPSGNSRAALLTDSASRKMSVGVTATATLQPTIAHGEIEPVQGWQSLESGSKLPAAALIYRTRSTMPLTFCTLLLPQLGNTLAAPQVTLRMPQGGEQIAVGATVAFGTRTDHLFSRPVSDRATYVVGEFRSDAEIAFVSVTPDAVPTVSGIIIGGKIWHENGTVLDLSVGDT